MRQGVVYKRCTRCSRSVTGKPSHCPHCGNDRFTWAYAIDIAQPGTARDLRKKSGFPTRAAAVEAVHGLREDVAVGRYVKPSPVTLAELARDYLNQADLRLSTWNLQAGYCRNYLIPSLGSTRVQALSRDAIQSFYRRLEREPRTPGERPLSPKTVHNLHLALHRILQLAVERRLLYTNPADGAHRQPAPPETRTWTASELNAFLAHVARHHLSALFRLLATTGMRRGDALGLRWSDLHFEEGYLVIQRQYSRQGRPRTTDVA